jgi:diguanylate cyclase (GGDEF)-like protein/hemerythrin-like metal-binding protein/PAS domain S-box-containing protein
MRVGRHALDRLAADGLIGSNLIAVCAIRGETLILLNERCAALLGRSGDEVHRGIPLRDVVADADWAWFEADLRKAPMKPGSRTSIAFSAVRKDGSIADLELAGMVAAGGGHPMVLAVATDVTHRVRTDAQLTHLAFNDGLTGLANRTLLFDRLRQTVMASRRSRDVFALLVCDLDRFKTVNDSYGHETGDAVLKAAAERLRSCCREVDTAARMGGDEFVLILPGLAAPSDAELVAGRVISALAAPIVLGKISVCVGVSIGIALYPKNGETIETLLSAADAAMYLSKATGTNRFSFAGTRKPEAAASGLRFIAWSDLHETGLPEIDAQHAKLAAMIGRLGSDLVAGESIHRMHATFEKLIASARAHFAAEEALMKRFAIEDRARHEHAHRKLLQDAVSMAAGLDESNMMLTMSFLNEWLLHHVDSDDKDLARQLQAKGYGEADRKPSPPARAHRAAAQAKGHGEADRKPSMPARAHRAAAPR